MGKMNGIETILDPLLREKVIKSLRLLKSVKDKTIEISYSGGKDSDVLLELAKMSGINFRTIHKCTTIDPPGTLAHCKKVGAEIIRPSKNMFQLIKERGFPTRRARFCCSTLKEYKVLDIASQGIRRSESAKRKKRYKEPIICRTYGSKKNRAQIILPLLDWTDKDIEAFIKYRKIKCHELYYRNGIFNVQERLGCIGCPLASDNGLADFKKYPKMVKCWIKSGLEWWNTHEEISSKKNFKNVYELFVHNVFFKSYEEFKLATNSPIYGKIDCKQFLENYFNIKL